VYRLLLLLLLLVGSGSFAQSAAAQGRALVIGNSAYVNQARLKNPKNDAEDIAALLSRLGFRVWLGLDLTRKEMESLIQDFSNELSDGSIGFFFYAGHGISIDERNYLLPIDVDFTTEQDAERGLIDLALVQGRMELSTENNILLIDACRDNPLSEALAKAAAKNPKKIGIGLAPQGTMGTLIGYSTQPGTTAYDGDGRNSPFTEALLKHLGTSKLDLASVLARVRADVSDATKGKQVPWDLSKRVSPISFDVVAQGKQTAVKTMRGGLSDRLLGEIIEMAFAMVPQTYRHPDGKVVHMDKTNRGSIVTAVDIVRDVAFAALRTAYASACSLSDHAIINHGTLHKRIRESLSLTDQQVIYLNLVHLAVVMYMTGSRTITDGAEVVRIPPHQYRCDESMKQFVQHKIERYAKMR
jgi:hypothetical protein